MKIVMSIHPSLYPHGTTRLPLDKFSWNLLFGIFITSVENILVPLKSDKNKRYFRWRPIYIFDHISLGYSSNEKCFRKKKITGNIKTHFSFSITVFRKTWGLWDTLDKSCITGQAADDKRAHAHCMLDTKGYKHTLVICSTYRISSATMVARTRLSVTLHVHCLSCSLLVELAYQDTPEIIRLFFVRIPCVFQE